MTRARAVAWMIAMAIAVASSAARAQCASDSDCACTSLCGANAGAPNNGGVCDRATGACHCCVLALLNGPSGPSSCINGFGCGTSSSTCANMLSNGGFECLGNTCVTIMSGTCGGNGGGPSSSSGGAGGQGGSDTIDCGDEGSCPSYLACGSENTCIPQGATDCGDGTYCDSGAACAAGGVCIPPGATDCGDGTYCPAGAACNCASAPQMCPANEYVCGGACCPTSQVCCHGQCLAAGRMCNDCQVPGAACPGGTLCCASGICPPPGMECAGPTVCPTSTPVWCNDGICAPQGVQCCGQGAGGGPCCGHQVYCTNARACDDCGGGVIGCGACGGAGGAPPAQQGTPGGVVPPGQSTSPPRRGAANPKGAPTRPHYKSRGCSAAEAPLEPPAPIPRLAAFAALLGAMAFRRFRRAS